MDTQKGINAGLILALIATWTYMGVIDLEPNYYCEDREIKAYCYDFSSTMKTCYTLPGKTGGKRCSSLWKEIPQIQVEPEVSAEINEIRTTPGRRWICGPVNCTRIA